MNKWLFSIMIAVSFTLCRHCFATMTFGNLETQCANIHECIAAGLDERAYGDYEGAVYYLRKALDFTRGAEADTIDDAQFYLAKSYEGLARRNIRYGRYDEAVLNIDDAIFELPGEYIIIGLKLHMLKMNVFDIVHDYQMTVKVFDEIMDTIDTAVAKLPRPDYGTYSEEYYNSLYFAYNISFLKYQARRDMAIAHAKNGRIEQAKELLASKHKSDLDYSLEQQYPDCTMIKLFTMLDDFDKVSKIAEKCKKLKHSHDLTKIEDVIINGMNNGEIKEFKDEIRSKAEEYFIDEDYEHAALYYELAICFFPFHEQDALSLAQSYEKTGRYGDAVKAYYRFLNLNSNGDDDVNDQIKRRIHLIVGN